MATTITYDGGPEMTPDSVDVESLNFATESRNVEHDTLDGDPVYTFRQGMPLAGTLRVLFTEDTAAIDCVEAHRLATPFTISSTERDSLNFRYVIAQGEARAQMEPRTAAGWWVTIPYRRV